MRIAKVSGNCPHGYERSEPSTMANLAELQKFNGTEIQ